MRGTAVLSFLFGSANPTPPPTCVTAALILTQCQKTCIVQGGVTMEGNCSDPSRTSCSSHQSAPSCFFIYLYPPTTLHSSPFSTRGALPFPSNGFLTHLSVAEGGSAALGGCTGRVDTGGIGRGREQGTIALFWQRIPRPFCFFSSPSCGFMAYLLVADFHLAMRGGSLADLLQRF